MSISNHSSELILGSRVAETNVALMVTCMPACATLIKHVSQHITIASSIKIWLSELRQSSDSNSPKGKQDEMNGNRSVTCTVMRCHDGFWQPKHGKSRGGRVVDDGFDMGDFANFSSGDATMPRSRASLHFYHASSDPAYHPSGHRESV